MGKLPDRKQCCRIWRKCATALMAAAFLPVPTLAANIPSAVEPSHITPLIEGPREPELSAPGESLPVFPKSVELPPPPTTENVRFILSAVKIEGATLYTPEQLRPYYAKSLGKIVPVAEAQAIANRITSRYRNDGYILSQAVVPRQDLGYGILHIRVVEGFVDRIIVEGDGKDADKRGMVEEYGAKIAHDRPLKIATLERYLLLMNELPGLSARAVLQPSADNFGAASLVVTLSRKRVDASLATGNRVTPYLGSLQQTATLAVNSLAGLDERTQMQASVATPERAMHLFGVQHEEQLDSEGTKLSVSASQTQTRPGLTLAPLQLEAVSKDVQFLVQHPFILLRRESLTGRIAFDYRNTDTTVFGNTVLSDDRVRALRVGGNYTFADRWRGASLIDAEASHGLNVMGASAPGDLRSNLNAPADFSKLNVDVSRTQPLQGNYSLFTALSAQLSADPLLAAEQFSVGGPAFGSAYDPGALAGDQGAAARAELRYDSELSGRVPLTYQAYGFYDLGAVWDRTKTPPKNSLASAGLGLRFGLTPHLSGTTELAVPLTKKAGLISEGHTPRVFFTLQATY